MSVSGQSRRTKQAAASPDVRFTPIATKLVRRNEVTLCADCVAKVQNYRVMIFWL
jgi:hypothetical protein